MNMYTNNTYSYYTKIPRGVFLGDVNFLFPVIIRVPSRPMFFYRALRNVT